MEPTVAGKLNCTGQDCICVPVPVVSGKKCCPAHLARNVVHDTQGATSDELPPAEDSGLGGESTAAYVPG